MPFNSTGAKLPRTYIHSSQMFHIIHSFLRRLFAAIRKKMTLKIKDFANRDKEESSGITTLNSSFIPVALARTAPERKYKKQTYFK